MALGKIFVAATHAENEVCPLAIGLERRSPRRSRGMSPRWSRCDIAATVENAHAASVKSVASGFWPAAGPMRANPVPGRSAPASSSSRDSDLPAFATAGLDGVTRVWGLARRDGLFGGETPPSDGSEAARAPFAATPVASVGAHGGSGVRAVAMARTADPAAAALATGSYDGAATVRAWTAEAETSASTKPHGRESVLSLAFSPDGAFLVTGAGDGVVRVWSAREDVAGGTPAETGNARARASLAIRDFGAARCVDAAPLRESAGEGDLIATGGEDGTIRVWSWRASDAEPSSVSASDEGPEGVSTRHPTCALMLKGHARGVTAMALCPVRGKDGSVREPYRSHRSQSRSCSFRIAAGSDTGAVAAWAFAPAVDVSASSAEAPTTRRLAFGAAHARGGVRACAFLAVESDVLASAAEDRTVRLWDLQTGACLCALTGARAAVECVAFSPDAAFLFAGAADGALAVWRDASVRGTREDGGHSGARARRDARCRYSGCARDSRVADAPGASARSGGRRRGGTPRRRRRRRRGVRRLRRRRRARRRRGVPPPRGRERRRGFGAARERRQRRGGWRRRR